MDYGGPEPRSEGPLRSRRAINYRLIAGVWFAGGMFLLALGGFAWWQSNRDDAESWVYVDENVRTVGDDLVAGASEAPAPLGERQYNLQIEKIGVDAVVAAYNAEDDGAPMVPLEGDVVAWYSFTPKPGIPGNAVYCGHAAWNGGDGVFARLSELQQGDRFSFVNDNGDTVTYNVYTSQPLDATAVALGDWFADTDVDGATLLTCEEPWFSGEPASGDPANWVVRGALVEVQTGD
jgi:sortase (surface protein transpeptidase)